MENLKNSLPEQFKNSERLSKSSSESNVQSALRIHDLNTISQKSSSISFTQSKNFMNNFTLNFSTKFKRTVGISMIAVFILISTLGEVFAQGFVPFAYTPRLGWNTSAYKSFRFTSPTPGVGEMNLRIKYPKDYDSAAVTTDSYPLIVFLHGKGEAGYDNDYHLIHGGQQHLAAVNNGKFNGFLLYPQHEYEYWSDGSDGNNSFMSPPIQKVIDMIDFLITRYRIDPNRISVHGLSMGGAGAWYIANKRPDLFASILPMSNGGLPGQIPNLVNTNIWLFQGERDVNPEPQAARLQRDRILAAGGQIRYKEYANVGHGTWNLAYAEPDFFSWISAQTQLSVHVFGNDPTFCVGSNLRLGVVKNLFQYEWSNGETTNEILVNTPGSYSVRFKRKASSSWSNWSDPVSVSIRSVTDQVEIIPNKTTAMAPSGGNVTLSAPEGFTNYLWSNGSTARSIQISTPGVFTVSVTASAKCISLPSNPIFVTRGPATSVMGTPSGVNATVLSPTAVDVTWVDNSNNETFFEIYAGASAGGSLTYLGKVNPGVTAFSATNLLPNRDYYFRIRAINNTGYSAYSGFKLVRTLPDILAPTNPINLVAIDKTASTISLSWVASTDNVGVTAYDVYKDNVLIASPTTNSFVVTGLVQDVAYSFKVRARDLTNNFSAFTNELVSTITFVNGLDYKYYEGVFSTIPDFANIIEVRGGKVNNFDISPRDLNNRFGFKFEGFVEILTAGQYTFFTTSDDGSDLWINGVKIVNNDGLHGAQERSGIVTLPAGKHAIIVRFFENDGGESLQVRWSGPGIAKNLIPNGVLYRINNFFDGVAPSIPSGLVAASKSLSSIYLRWNASTDNVGVTEYLIFRNGVNIGTSTSNKFEVEGLDTNTNYTFSVSAKDGYGNESAQSLNLVDALVLSAGVSHKYFEGSYSVIPDFKYGIEKRRASGTNFSIAPRDVNDNFGFRFETVISITTAGTYTFFTSSDAGSKLYINDAQVVNNDGVHNVQERSGTIAMTPGKYSLVVDYFETTGSESLTVQWSGPGIPKATIPTSLLEKFFFGVDVIAPSVVTNLNGSAARNSIALSWNPASDNQKVVSYSVFNNGVFVATTTGNSQVLTGLTANTVYNFGVVTNDFAGLKSDTSKLSVSTLGNQAPTFATVANQVISEGDSIFLTVTGLDFENDNFTFTTSNFPSFVTSTNLTSGVLLTIKPDATQAGIYTVLNLIVTDQFGAAYNQLFNLTVLNANQAPLIENISDVMVDETMVVNTIVTATDEAGSVLALSASGLPSFVTFSDNGDGTGIITSSPGYNDAGVYSTVVISATDGSLVSSVNVQINVNNSNRLPVLASIGSQSVTALNNLTVSISATDEDAESIIFSSTSLPTFATLVDNTDGTGSLSFSPLNTDAGIFTFDVIATDISGGITSETINLTVTGDNFVPQVLIADQFVDENNQLNLVITATDDNTNDVLVLSVNNLPAFATFTDNGDRTANMLFAPGFYDAGTYSNISITANDGFLSATDSFEVTVNNVNQLPIVNSLVDQLVVTGSNVLINVSANDADGDALILNASNLPSFAIFTDNGDGTGVLALSPLATDVGTFTAITFTAADASSTSLPAAFDLQVQAFNNIPVVAAISNKTLDENSTLTVLVSATDADGDNIVLTASNLPSFALFTDNGNGTGTINLTPGSTHFGAYPNVTISATDVKGATGTSIFSINVNDVNILYRVNCGGAAIVATPISWGVDNITTKSIYLDPTSQNATAGSSAWTGVNTTGAPNNIFGQYRTFFSGRVPVMYNFPATNNGEYIINLFFHSKAVNGVNAAGVRRFDVRIEGITVLSNYDIFADAGNAAVRKSFRVNVTDGNIDIDLARVLADPIISGIEIVGITSPSGLKIETLNSTSNVISQTSSLLNVTVSPNPFKSNLTIRFNEEVKEQIQLVIVDIVGKVVYQEVQTLLNGTNEVQISLPENQINNGVYLLKLTSNDGRTQLVKLIKE